jgi:hypothetical protein
MTNFAFLEAEWPSLYEAAEKASLIELDEIFASLQYRAFRGEL